jgi:branched-chain amino acid transport system permease protein
MLASVTEDLLRAVLQGAPPGTVYALIALGFVLAYKTSGVFNLAFGAQAYVSAIVYFTAHVTWGWGALPSFVLAVVLVAPLLGVLLEFLVFRHLRTAPPVSGLVVAIGLTVALPPLAEVILGYEPVGRRPEGIVPNGNSVFYEVFGVYSFSRNELVAMVAASLAVLGLAVLFRYTSAGLRMRAVVESPRMTELNGIDANRVSASAWALSSFFAGLAGVLIAPRFSMLSSAEYLNIVVVAIAAAAIGLAGQPSPRLRRRPRPRRAHRGVHHLRAALVAGPGVPATHPGERDAGHPVHRPAGHPDLRAGHPALAAGHRPALRRRPAPVVARPGDRRGSPEGRHPRGLGIAALVVVAVVVYTRADGVWTFLVTQALVLAVVFLSFTVITGLAGPHLAGPGLVRGDRRHGRVPARRPLRGARARGRARRRAHRGRGGDAGVAAHPAPQRDLDRHRHVGVRVLLPLGHREVLLGRRHPGRPGLPGGAPSRPRPVGLRRQPGVHGAGRGGARPRAHRRGHCSPAATPGAPCGRCAAASSPRSPSASRRPGAA